jgi:hypothetical protein
MEHLPLKMVEYTLPVACLFIATFGIGIGIAIAIEVTLQLPVDLRSEISIGIRLMEIELIPTRLFSVNSNADFRFPIPISDKTATRD